MTHVMCDTKMYTLYLIIASQCENDKFNTLRLNTPTGTWLFLLTPEGYPESIKSTTVSPKLLPRHAYSLNANKYEALFVYGVRSNVISHAHPISALFTVGIS